MPRIPGRKAVPWMLVLEAAMIAREHWGRLDPRDRTELQRIIRKSKGRPNTLTPNERAELLRIARLLDPLTAGRKLMPFRGGVRRGR
jgi:predicted deacylase